MRVVRWALVSGYLVVAACSRETPRAEPAPSPGPLAPGAPVVSVSSAVPEAEPAPSQPVAASAASDGGGDAAAGCVVSVDRLVEAAVYRGPGVDSPARQKTMQSLSPRQRDQWRGRDHGVKHLACTYVVRVNGQRYRYRHTAEQSFTGLSPDTAKCAADATQRDVETRVREFTKQCSDLRAGEYWGYRLDPQP